MPRPVEAAHCSSMHWATAGESTLSPRGVAQLVVHLLEVIPHPAAARTGVCLLPGLGNHLRPLPGSGAGCGCRSFVRHGEALHLGCARAGATTRVPITTAAGATTQVLPVKRCCSCNCLISSCPQLLGPEGLVSSSLAGEIELETHPAKERCSRNLRLEGLAGLDIGLEAGEGRLGYAP